jgi:hypothetical protein
MRDVTLRWLDEPESSDLRLAVQRQEITAFAAVRRIMGG